MVQQKSTGVINNTNDSQFQGLQVHMSSLMSRVPPGLLPLHKCPNVFHEKKVYQCLNNKHFDVTFLIPLESHNQDNNSNVPPALQGQTRAKADFL